MAEAQRKESSELAVVSACDATDCAHNEDRNCHADSVSIQIQNGTAVCGTYTPESPRPRP